MSEDRFFIEGPPLPPCTSGLSSQPQGTPTQSKPTQSAMESGDSMLCSESDWKNRIHSPGRARSAVAS
ncbi:hypothetical protein BCR37DRAFT_376807, partial [Protomyces lactucae-debilis]